MRQAIKTSFLCFPSELKCFSHTILKALSTVAAVFLTVGSAGKQKNDKQDTKWSSTELSFVDRRYQEITRDCEGRDNEHRSTRENRTQLLWKGEMGKNWAGEFTCGGGEEE